MSRKIWKNESGKMNKIMCKIVQNYSQKSAKLLYGKKCQDVLYSTKSLLQNHLKRDQFCASTSFDDSIHINTF